VWIPKVGIDEATLRQYIQKQEDEDRRYEQMNLCDWKGAEGGAQKPL